MSSIGYHGEDYEVLLDGVVVAAIESNGITLLRENIDASTKDSARWQRFLPGAGKRGISVPFNGVVTEDNLAIFVNLWLSEAYANITLRDSENDTYTAADGFCLENLEYSAPKNDKVVFSGTFQSSGAITYTGEIT